jgi:hypothetical protein
MSNGKGSQRKPVSLYNKIADSTTRLTVGALLRRLGVALDKCAENHEPDADKKAYLQTELMAAHGAYLCGSHRGAGSGEEEEEGGPKERAVSGRRVIGSPIGAEGPRAPRMARGPRGLGPPQKHKTKAKGGLTTGNGDLVWLMWDFL